jgi:cell division protein FtsN
MKRGRGNGGFFQRIGLLLAAVVILALTFTLGVLVGRQWGGRPAETADGGRKSAALTRRALSEVEAERPREMGEKLTFYQTLTAPLGPTGQSSRARAEERGVAPVPAPAPAPALTAPPSAPAAVAATAPAAPPVMWTVQVGAFRSRQQADGVQRRLAEAGFPAVLSTVALEDGQSRYRVRVGGARSRGEAEQLAQQVRARVPVTTLVTAN